MGVVRVTAHAVSRYRERVAPLPYDEVVAILSTERIRQAVEFGAREIILGTGHHAVVANNHIITIRPKVRRSRLRCGKEARDGD